MENRVGDVVPSEAEVEKLAKDLSSVEARLAKLGSVLTPEERQGALKPPDGSETTTKLIVQLLQKHNVSLPGIKAEDIEADLLLAARLAPLGDALTRIQRLLQDIVLQANSERWSATTAGYTALVRTMDADPALRQALDPALKAFGVGKKRGPRKPSAPPVA